MFWNLEDTSLQDVRYNEFTTFGARAMVKGLRINKFVGNLAQELYTCDIFFMYVHIHSLSNCYGWTKE